MEQLTIEKQVIKTKLSELQNELQRIKKLVETIEKTKVEDIKTNQHVFLIDGLIEESKQFIKNVTRL